MKTANNLTFSSLFIASIKKKYKYKIILQGLLVFELHIMLNNKDETFLFFFDSASYRPLYKLHAPPTTFESKRIFSNICLIFYISVFTKGVKDTNSI